MTDGQTFAEVQERYAEFFGSAAALYNVNPLLGRLYGYLVLAPEPMTLGDLSRAAGAAKSTVSVAMRTLEHYRVVRRSWIKGDRRDYFMPRMNVNEVLRELFQLFFSHELKYMREANLTAKQALESSQAGGDWPSDDKRRELLQRIEILEGFSDLITTWLEQFIGEGQQSVSKAAETIEIEVEE
ncbi:GbsR/MarR family transcriptional regulator [Alicyclobacillus sp. SO9]|uniref:GbsR/MarR family transcriptional regulator n=1 Tax=Alicyclobacillus sp. SO9 TaxID=2665646 RepID=UPI0018E717E1|nr:helix-turn-helix domain-containing protein [Alicyclobacillus sp. SO9]QQE77538.1 helix-turn-helix domain-containing protein [Alicyclobacillus sp. SO9]